jgi:hypothetical protein
VLVNYHQCTPLLNPVHTHVKVFANTAHVRTMGGNPHEVVYLSPDFFTVNELGHKVCVSPVLVTQCCSQQSTALTRSQAS